MMLKKLVFCILVVILAIILLIVFRLLINPANQSADEIRNHLLIETPVGSCEEEVRAFIMQHDHWQIIVERFGDDVRSV